MRQKWSVSTVCVWHVPIWGLETQVWRAQCSIWVRNPQHPCRSIHKDNCLYRLQIHAVVWLDNRKERENNNLQAGVVSPSLVRGRSSSGPSSHHKLKPPQICAKYLLFSPGDRSSRVLRFSLLVHDHTLKRAAQIVSAQHNQNGKQCSRQLLCRSEVLSGYLAKNKSYFGGFCYRVIVAIWMNVQWWGGGTNQGLGQVHGGTSGEENKGTSGLPCLYCTSRWLD